MRRRTLLSLLPSALSGAIVERFPTSPSDVRRFLDAATENEISRLTDPSYSSILPGPEANPVARRGNFLVVACDRTGSLQPFRLDLRTGQSTQIAAVDHLRPEVLALSPDERSVLFLDGDRVQQFTFAGRRMRELASLPAGAQVAPGVAVSEDGALAFVMQAGGRYRVVTVHPQKPGLTTLMESEGAAAPIAFRPRSRSLLIRQGPNRLLIHTGSGVSPLDLTAGEVMDAAWNTEGTAVLYLHRVPEQRRVVLRELMLESRQDKLIALTSQYARFAPNRDDSVFVGASRSVAGPYISLLLRVGKRERVLCEHRASTNLAVTPLFTPNSRRVLFPSDRHGKPAVYMINLDRLVEPTEETP